VNHIQHLIEKHASVRDALILLDKLSLDAILFVINDSNQLIGSLTDGDIRRGFIKGLDFTDPLSFFMNNNPSFIRENKYTFEELESYSKFRIVPILDTENHIIDVLNFRFQQTILPVNAVIMAGGKGQRLMPLTEFTPKPLLIVGDKPIIEHNIDRLIKVGVNNITISVNYLGEQIVDFFKNGSSKGIIIDYIHENKPLGTIGSLLLKDKFLYDDILVMNSDLLTNIDLYDFFKTYKNCNADIAIAAVGYKVKIPYGVLQTSDVNLVMSISEKPTYTYFSNAGIYLLKKELLSLIPKDSFYDITDLLERAMEMSYKLITYPINGYWLDIGKHDDYVKAQEDIKHIKL
jgi:dTDP-glucose pyrophosphorylase